MTAARPRLVDFHSHYYDPTWAFTPVPQAGSGLARSWPLLTDLRAQLDALAAGSIDTKVLSAPASSVVAPNAQLEPALMREINDRFAALVAEYPGRLLALATIDAFQGDTAAAEVERAVQRLGIGGICVDCSQGDRFLDDPAARPTLEAAAALAVPVFVHPVSPPGASERWSSLGHIGVLLARGSEDAVGVLTLMRSGILDALPGLTIVIPSIGAAALVFAGIADGARGRADGWTGTPPRIARQRLYVDTMGFDPAMIRFAVETVGTDHVLLGSDWPVMPLAPRDEIILALNGAGIPQEMQPAILGENALRLLTHRTTR